MKILIKVTKEVLERSKMCGIDTIPVSRNCGIAVAIIDLFPKARIESSRAWLITKSRIETDKKSKVILPQKARCFISEFDSKTPEQRVLMTPFSFEIEVPEYVIEKIGIGQIYKVLSESRTLEMVM